MNREIKFRAWDKETKEICLVNKLEFYFEDTNGILANVFEDRVGAGFTRDIFPENLILMQSTGLLDKNGKEIYEGDICENGDWVDGAKAYCNRIEEIRWDENNGCWQGWNHNIDGMICEVIGNIYENPHLLPKDNY